MRVFDAPAELLRRLAGEGITLGAEIDLVGRDRDGALLVRLGDPPRIVALPPGTAATLRVSPPDAPGPDPAVACAPACEVPAAEADRSGGAGMSG